MPQAHGLERAQGVSAGGPAPDACHHRHPHPGTIRQGPGPRVHRGLRPRVLAAGLRQVAALEEHPGQGGRCQEETETKTKPQLTPPPSPSLFQILPGNINTYSEVENALQPIIFASKIRIYPYGQYDRTVCLRAEIVGCPWEGE